MVAVSIIGGGNRRTRRKPPTCCKSLTNFIIAEILLKVALNTITLTPISCGISRY
jgi:hypothetical protein